MSRQNKVNPGMYTQRGRLSQDDGARELARQRSSIASQHNWQPDSKNATPWPTNNVPGASVPGAGESAAEVAKPTAVKAAEKKPVRAAAKPVATKTVKTAAKSPAKRKKKTARTAPVKAKAKAAKTPKSRAKSGRKAVLARNAAGPAAKRRRSATRRKS